MGDIMSTVSIGTDDPGESVGVMRTASRQAVILPRALMKLRGEQLEAAADLQHVVAELMRWQVKVDEAVADARAQGLSWGAVGWCVGTTAQAAQRRWAAAVK